MTFDNNSLNYRFPLWLTVIFFTLFSIPLLVFLEFLTLAKIFGMVAVVLTTIALRYWMRIAKLKSNNLERVQLTKNDIFDLKRLYPYFNKLSVNEQIEIQDKIGLTLARFRFIDEFGDHYSKMHSIQLALYIVLSNPSNLSTIKNCVIVNSEIIIDKINELNSFYRYPLIPIIEEKIICSFNFNELSQQKVVLDFAKFISRI